MGKHGAGTPTHRQGGWRAAPPGTAQGSAGPAGRQSLPCRPKHSARPDGCSGAPPAAAGRTLQDVVQALWGVGVGAVGDALQVTLQLPGAAQQANLQSRVGGRVGGWVWQSGGGDRGLPTTAVDARPWPSSRCRCCPRMLLPSRHSAHLCSTACQCLRSRPFNSDPAASRQLQPKPAQQAALLAGRPCSRCTPAAHLHLADRHHLIITLGVAAAILVGVAAACSARQGGQGVHGGGQPKLGGRAADCAAGRAVGWAMGVSGWLWWGGSGGGGWWVGWGGDGALCVHATTWGWHAWRERGAWEVHARGER